MDTHTDITPALTAEEWEAGKRPQYYREQPLIAVFPDGEMWIARDEMVDGAPHPADRVVIDAGDPASRHALAALALHGQPFGFTRADLEVIDDAIDEAWNAAAENHTPTQDATTNRVVAGLASIRDRLAALLPPE